MTKETISLPSQLREVFLALYETKERGSGWNMWSAVFGADPSTAEFTERLSLVQSGCAKLQGEITTLGLDERMVSEWLTVIARLRSLTTPAEFHLPAAQWKARATPVDVNNLMIIHTAYLMRGLFGEIESDELSILAADVQALIERVDGSQLDEPTKALLKRILRELDYSIENIRRFGIDEVWKNTSHLMGTVFRYEDRIKSADEANPAALLRTEFAKTVKRVTQFVMAYGALRDGIVGLAGDVPNLISHLITSAS